MVSWMIVCARLARLAPDLVVIGNAMTRGNPEVEWLLDTRALAFTSLPAFLHDHVLRRRQNLVICGTHGKTTTTSLTAFLLRAAGRDPGFLIGGVPQDPPVGSHLGADAQFVPDAVRTYVLSLKRALADSLRQFQGMKTKDLLDARHAKLMAYGKFKETLPREE